MKRLYNLGYTLDEMKLNAYASNAGPDGKGDKSNFCPIHKETNISCESWLIPTELVSGVYKMFPVSSECF